jgi:hypothetical protein
VVDKRILRRLAWVLGVLAVTWLVTAYLLMPTWWRRHVRAHPELRNIPNITHTRQGIPGDPLNLALIGTEDQMKRSLMGAGWYPADPLTLKSCLGIAAATVLERPYEDAPVSNLYLWGRKQDLAFEQPVGDDPRKRHHVRFWRSELKHDDGRPIWIGAGTYDSRVGLSHTTGQITHHISGNVDEERDHIGETLQKAGRLSRSYYMDDFHSNREGRNGGGDPWWTDGRLFVGVLALE